MDFRRKFLTIIATLALIFWAGTGARGEAPPQNEIEYLEIPSKCVSAMSRAMDDLRDWYATTGSPQYPDFHKFLDAEIGKASCQESDGNLLVKFYPRPGWLGGGASYVLDGKTFDILNRTFN